MFLHHLKIKSIYGNEAKKNLSFISLKLFCKHYILYVFSLFYCRDLFNCKSVISSVKLLLNASSKEFIFQIRFIAYGCIW